MTIIEIIDLAEYMRNHPFSQEILRKEVYSKDIDQQLYISVFYEDIMFDGSKSRMILFSNGMLITNCVSFPCSIETNDMSTIALSMIDEYLNEISKHTGNETEALDGVISYDDEDDNVYYKLLFKSPKDTYLLSNVDFVETEKTWNKIYGHKSENHKQYVHDELIKYLNKYMAINGDDRYYINELQQYIKSNSEYIE